MLSRRNLLASAASAAALAPIGPALAQNAAPAASIGEGAKLHALMDAFMTRNLRRFPEFPTYLGIDKGEYSAAKSQLSDSSYEQVLKDRVEAERRLGELKAIDRAALTGKDVIFYDVLLYSQENTVAGIRRFPIAAGGVGGPYGITQQGGAYQQIPDFLDSMHRIETKDDAEAYLSRLSAFGRVLDQERELVERDVAEGVIPPDFTLDKTRVQMEALRGQPLDKAILVQSVVRRAKDKNIPGDWEARASKIYVEAVQPALDRQLVLVARMRARSTHDAGVWKLKDGQEFYAMSLQQATTTRMTPEEVHKLGLDLCASLSAKVDGLMRAEGLTKGTTGERYRAMFSDPKYLYPNTDEAKARLLADLNGQMKVISAKLPKYFGQLPKAPLEIKAVPKYLEAGASGGYYNPGSLDGSRPGAYYINLRDTAEVPSWTLPTLTYHEGSPGHHLQLTLQQESDVPMLMKVVGFNAYSEGWGLYSEELAVEMGMYENDRPGQIGMIHDALLRSVRLVVDSGMHAKQWSRERAVKFFVDTIGDPESGAITEVERYCVSPGQACSYMVGKIEFLKLRQRARDELGNRFDIRQFHDAVLLNGALPLTVLGRQVDRYIAAAKAA